MKKTRVRKQPIIVLYFESETVLKYYNLEAWLLCFNCILAGHVTGRVLCLFLVVPLAGL